MDKIYVSFHVGRGGRWHNPGHISFRGEYDFQKVLEFCGEHLFWYTEDEDGNPLPEDEWHVDDWSGTEMLHGREEIESKTGRLNFDNDYDTDYTTTLEECDEKELEAIKNTLDDISSRSLSKELKQYVRDYFGIEEEDENDF